MATEAKSVYKNKISNFFGAFGYLFCAFQWFWSTVLYAGVIMSLLQLSNDLNVNEKIIKPVTPVEANPNLGIIFISAIIIIVMIIITFYVLAKIPSTVTKTEKKIIHNTAKKAVPLIFKIQHKKYTEKSGKKLTYKVIIVLKLLLIFIPIVMAILSILLDNQMLDFGVVMTICTGLASISLISFFIQYGLAKLFKVKTELLW